MLRDVFKYPNAADFLIEGRQTGNWNLIRSSTPAMPIQNARNQYFNVKVCSLTLPMKPEILKHPGVFIVLDESTRTNKNCTNRINRILEIEESGFPCEYARTLEEIAKCYYTTVEELTCDQIREARLEDSRDFYGKTDLSNAAFWMVCDKLQFNEHGEAMWIQYKSCMDQHFPLNWRENSIRFKVLDPNGKVLQLGIIDNCPPKCDPYAECAGECPVEGKGDKNSALIEFGGVFVPPINVELTYCNTNGLIELYFPLVSIESAEPWSPIVSLNQLPPDARPTKQMTFSKQIVYDGKIGTGSITIDPNGTITVQRPVAREGVDSGSYGWLETSVIYKSSAYNEKVCGNDQVYALLEVTYLPYDHAAKSQIELTKDV